MHSFYPPHDLKTLIVTPATNKLTEFITGEIQMLIGVFIVTLLVGNTCILSGMFRAEFGYCVT